MAATVHDVAHAIRRRLLGVKVLKVHKLLYYCQGHHLEIFGEPLFVERIEAWKYGPVCADLWHDESRGRGPEEFGELDNGQLNTVGFIVSRYGRNSDGELVTLTHKERPWQMARLRGVGLRNPVISNESIREFFINKTARDEEIVRFAPADVARFLQEAKEREDAVPAQPDTRESLMALRERLTRA